MPADASIYGLQQPVKFNSPFDVLKDIEQLRAQQENRRGLKEQREAIAEQRRAQTELTRQKSADIAAIDTAYAGGGEFDDILGRLPGHLRADVGKQLHEASEFNTKAQTAKQAAAKAELDYTAHLASGVLFWEKDGPESMMNAAQTAIAVAKKHGYDVTPIEQAIAKNPAQLKPMLQSIIAQSQGPQKPKENYTLGNQRMSGEDNSVLATAEPDAPNVGTLGDYMTSFAAEKGLNVNQLSPRDKLQAKARFEAAGRAPDKPDKPTYEWANVGGENKLLTPAEIRGQGGTKPMTATEALDERKYKKADPVLRGISELSEKINTGKGILAKMGGGAAKLAAKANYDDDVAEYTALVSGFTPMVARALGHTGVLTQQDVDSVKALFPLPGDSKTLRDRKMKRVLGIIGDLEGATSGPAKPAPPATGAGKETPEARIKRLLGGG